MKEKLLKKYLIQLRVKNAELRVKEEILSGFEKIDVDEKCQAFLYKYNNSIYEGNCTATLNSQLLTHNWQKGVDEIGFKFIRNS